MDAVELDLFSLEDAHTASVLLDDCLGHWPTAAEYKPDVDWRYWRETLAEALDLDTDDFDGLRPVIRALAAEWRKAVERSPFGY
jgi:hypothetical protein